MKNEFPGYCSSEYFLLFNIISSSYMFASHTHPPLFRCCLYREYEMVTRDVRVHRISHSYICIIVIVIVVDGTCHISIHEHAVNLNK